MTQRRAHVASTAIVTFKVTPDERQAMIDRANALGVALSEYIRQAALPQQPAIEYTEHSRESLALVGGTT